MRRIKIKEKNISNSIIRQGAKMANNLIFLNYRTRHIPLNSRIVSNMYENVEKIYHWINYGIIFRKIKKIEDVRIISLDSKMDDMLEKNEIRYSSVNEYISEKDYTKFEKRAKEFTRNMNKLYPEIDVKYKDISLFKMNESDIFETFTQDIIITIESIKEVIKCEKAKRIIILDNSTKLGKIQKQFNHIDKSPLYLNLKDKCISFMKHFLFRLMRKKPEISDCIPVIDSDTILFSSERGVEYMKRVIDNVKPTIVMDGDYKHKYSHLDYVLLNDYFWWFPATEYRFKVDEIKKRYAKLDLDNMQYNGIFLKEIMQDMLSYLFYVGYPKGIYYLECFMNLYYFNKLKLAIILCENPISQQANLLMSKKFKVKSMLMMHGVIGERDRYDNLLSDKICVWGEHYKNIIAKLNNSKKKIIVTGNPAWDNIGENKCKSGKNILLASTHYPIHIRNSLAYATFDAMKQLKGYKLIIKLHPEEDDKFYNDLIKEYYTVDASIWTGDLHKAINMSKLVIISDSTVGLEAVLLNKPVIDFNLSSASFWNDYVKERVAIGVRHKDHLLSAIKYLLSNDCLKKNRKKYIQEHYKKDATYNTIKVIQELRK